MCWEAEAMLDIVLFVKVLNLVSYASEAYESSLIHALTNSL